ncbi:ATP-binding protein [Actinomadura opuntiae]|uniref:ATP-binding protein n=1 Tax=Actinomadura sp. OS1-43 TaxID=604315 RepID=UPI00255AD296|nr:ATP-binding protein [Actinomadura sp. OS1-43]MDL4817750.1 ATP-binding protein [Actinomadura sp. OS1-43]
MHATVLTPDLSTLILDPTRRAPALARRFLADRFREWKIEDDSDARLVVSELVTNALLHGAGQIIVRLFRDETGGAPVLEVWDQGQGQPVVQPESDTRITGRGLLTVTNLTTKWGTRPITEGGKVVWAHLAA